MYDDISLLDLLFIPANNVCMAHVVKLSCTYTHTHTPAHMHTCAALLSVLGLCVLWFSQIGIEIQIYIT